MDCEKLEEKMKEMEDFVKKLQVRCFALLAMPGEGPHSPAAAFSDGFTFSEQLSLLFKTMAIVSEELKKNHPQVHSEVMKNAFLENTEFLNFIYAAKIELLQNNEVVKSNSMISKSFH